MEWNKFYYNGYETNVEVTSDGRIRRIKTDWCKGTSLGDVDFSKLKDDGYYNRLKVMIKGLGRKTIKVQSAPFTDYSYIEKNEGLSWLLSKYENASDRYMEAEDFILEIAEMKWYKRLFCYKKIMAFLNSRSKYKF